MKGQKRIVAAVLSAVMLLSCLTFTGSNLVNASEESTPDSRVYIETAKATFESLIDAKEAPVKEGYLFAGWVAKKSDGTGVAIKSKDDTVLNEAGVTITAKFIPAHLAGVACQVTAGTFGENDAVAATTNLRMVSVVDNGTYQGFGFNLYKRLLNADGSYTEVALCQGIGNASQTTDRYSGLYVYSGETKTVKTPADLFGEDAQGYYFTTARIDNIPQAVYDTCILVIKPYWITADGTYVEGLGEYDRVSDGKNGIVNISVNIKDAANIAAGMLNVKFDNAKYTFVSFDAGRVFEEMNAVLDNDTVKCVGNVGDMKYNSDLPEDIYINLRFQKTDSPAAGTSTFTVEAMDFCTKDEQDASVTIENVIF